MLLTLYIIYSLLYIVKLLQGAYSWLVNRFTNIWS